MVVIHLGTNVLERQALRSNQSLYQSLNLVLTYAQQQKTPHVRTYVAAKVFSGLNAR
jgi:hypothetical protein